MNTTSSTTETEIVYLKTYMNNQDEEIKKQVQEIYRLTIDNNQLNIANAQKNEEIREMQEHIDHKTTEVNENLLLNRKVQKKAVNNSDKVCKITGGFIIATLIVTGIVIVTLKYG